MNELTQKILKLEKSLHEVSKRIHNLASENQSLREKLEATTSELNTQKNRVKDLEDNQNLVKIAGTISRSEDDSNELKQRIDTYLEEIDKCIALLSR
ncbi:MAG: hypothetical protein GC181_06800 [Bacteroidetes bacterium]|nr:hypothetical protein [Bacteroidota bacterium]